MILRLVQSLSVGYVEIFCLERDERDRPEFSKRNERRDLMDELSEALHS